MEPVVALCGLSDDGEMAKVSSGLSEEPHIFEGPGVGGPFSSFLARNHHIREQEAVRKYL